MLNTIIRTFFRTPAHNRDWIIRKNVVNSLVFQFFTNVIGLLVVPLSLSYINKEKYGIWINASVMVTWLQNMNFGMGFGMQNKVAEAMAKKEVEKAREYVSIVYRYSVFIAGIILVLGLIASNFINWNKLFNSSLPSWRLQIITLVAFAGFLVNFVCCNITPLSNALHYSYVPKLFGLFTNILTVLLLFSISTFSHNNLILAAIALALPTPFVFFAGNIIFFKRKFRLLKPRWRIQDKNSVNEIFSLGIKFFIMQLCTLVITQSGVLVITQYMGPAEVTPYNIITRYFYFIYFIFTLAVNPYWSGITDAYFKKDLNWIRKAIKQLFTAGIAGALAICVMLALSFYVIPIWSNYAFNIHEYKYLVYSSAFLTITMFFSMIISILLNSLNLLNLQLFIMIFIAVFTVLVSIMLIKWFHLGSTAINIAGIIGQILYIGLCGWQAYRYMTLKVEMA